MNIAWTDQSITVGELRMAARTVSVLKRTALECLRGLAAKQEIDGLGSIAPDWRPVMARVGSIALQTRWERARVRP